MEVCEHPDTPAGSFALVSLHEEIMTLQHGTEMVGYYHQISGDIYKLSGLSPRANYTDRAVNPAASVELYTVTFLICG